MMREIPLFKVNMSPDADERVKQVLHSGHIAQGPVVDEFEVQLKKVLDVQDTQEIVTVNSGTSALHLAYILAGIGPGDEVLVSPMTCAATIAPIIHLGARPIWIDVDGDGNMSPLSVKMALKWCRRAKALVTIDWAGTPNANMQSLQDLANQHGLAIIEDAAHAFGAQHQVSGQYQLFENCSLACYASIKVDHFVCYSFQAIKHLTTGDGGAVVMSKMYAERARKLRWFGLDRTSKVDFRAGQLIEEAGYKWHMNDIAAAIGLANIPSARQAVMLHRHNAKILHDALQDVKRIKLQPFHDGSSYWFFPMQVDDREHFIAWMAQRSIATSQVHRRCDDHPAFKAVAGWQPPREFLDEFAEHQINVPCGWWCSPEDLQRIIEAVKQWSIT